MYDMYDMYDKADAQHSLKKIVYMKENRILNIQKNIDF